MKVAIHPRETGFSDYWIDYCNKKNIDYKVVNAFDSDVIQQLQDCDLFLWHHHHAHYKDVIVAKKILFALEHAGVKVFPDFKTGWHFDDKVAQKYLLEAIEAPLVPSYVFYDKKKAKAWAKKSTYPKVFKLKGGCGASNVKLVKTEKSALKLIKKSFGKGFSQFNRFEHFNERLRKYVNGKSSTTFVLKGVARLFITTDFNKQQPSERGYAYFQDFISDNSFDTRVVVVDGKKAAAEKRFVRKNDFRASGSGDFSYDDINIEIIKISFEVAKNLKLQSVAFDFVLDENNKPLIVEMSYGFGTDGIAGSPGYWDDKLNWFAGDVASERWIIESLLNKNENITS